MENKKIIIGITGLPGVGKTEVLKVMKEEGFFILEGDSIAHKIFDEKREEIERIFQKEGIQRKEVAEIIFRDEIKREKFESFIHPLILKRIFDTLENTFFTYVAVEATLLFELKTEDRFDLVITVASNLSDIYERMRRKGFNDEIITQMIERGLSQDEKIKRADICIDNRGDIKELRRKVKRLCRVIKRK